MPIKLIDTLQTVYQFYYPKASHTQKASQTSQQLPNRPPPPQFKWGDSGNGLHWRSEFRLTPGQATSWCSSFRGGGKRRRNTPRRLCNGIPAWYFGVRYLQVCKTERSPKLQCFPLDRPNSTKCQTNRWNEELVSPRWRRWGLAGRQISHRDERAESPIIPVRNHPRAPPRPLISFIVSIQRQVVVKDRTRTLRT